MNREKLYEFIDSKAIREYLIELNYELKPVEAALIVWQSDYKTLNEKREAYKWIIENTADFKFNSRYIEEELTFHELLSRYMEIQSLLLDAFMEVDTNAVYTYRLYWEGDSDMSDGKGIFQSFSELKNAIKDDGYSSVIIEKKWISRDEKYPKTLNVFLRGDETVMNIIEFNFLPDDDEEIFSVFDNEIWIDIPVPFKKGDILTFENGKFSPQYVGPMVFDYLMQWNMEPERIKRNIECWGIMDMIANGYFLSKDRIYYECMHNYLKLDYYNGELTGEKRIFKALSSYLRGDIPVDLLMNSYHIIKTEESLKDDRKYMNFLAETMGKAGLDEVYEQKTNY